MSNDDFSIDLYIESLRKAYTSLEKAYNIYSTGNEDKDICDIYADSCIKRFEYTFETAWKTMKKYLKLQYFQKARNLVQIIPEFLNDIKFLLNKWDSL